MDGCLRLAVLRQLSRKPLAGYGLLQAIASESGWKPSPGSLYPLLNQLVEEDSCTVKAQGRRKVYTLTRHGQSALEELLGRNRERFERLASQLRVCAPRADEDTALLKRLSEGEAPFGWLSRDLMELKGLAARASSRDMSASQKRDVQQAMRVLLQSLRRAT